MTGSIDPNGGSDKCGYPGKRWLHINDAVGSSVLGGMTSRGFEHQVQIAKVFDETSRRRRWMVWQRRRRNSWEWTDSECTKSSNFHLPDLAEIHTGYAAYLRGI